MKKIFFLLLSFVALSLCAASEKYPELWLKQDFEDPKFFSVSKILNGQADGLCKWSGLAMPHSTIVRFDDPKYSQALCIKRFEGHVFDFSGLHAMPENRDYVLSFDAFLHRAERTFCLLLGKNDKFIAGVNLEGANNLKMFDSKGVWGATGVMIPEGWSHIEVEFNAAEKTCVARLTAADGSVTCSAVMPMLLKELPLKLRFGTVLPLNTVGVIDNLEIRYAAYTKIANRDNAAESAELKLKGMQKNSDGTMALTGRKGILQYTLVPKSEVSSIRFAANPDMKVNIKAVNNAGEIKTLAKDGDFVNIDKNLRQIDFKADTFKTFYFECAGKIKDTISEIGIYGTKFFSRQTQDEIFQKKISGEFQLPVYELEKDFAELHVFNSEKNPIPVRIVLSERFNGKVITQLKQTLTPGRNTVLFEIKNLPEGHYVAEIEDWSRPKEKVKGTMRRLLRRTTTPDPVFAQNSDMTGQKLLFPDDYYLANHKNITFIPAQAESFKVTQDHHDPELLMQLGTGMTLKDNKILVDFTALDNHFRSATSRKFRAEASLDDLTKWTTVELSKNDAPLQSDHAVSHELFSWDNKPKPDKNGKITYRFYDPARDGKVDFKQVEFKYVHWMSNDSVLGSNLPDWGIVKPAARTTWPIWHKQPGESLLLTRKPLLTENRSNGEFENPDDSNDNFAGQWVSDDGKTLYFVACTVLRRYPPYNVKYDLLPNGIRILSVIKTSDGINFSRSYMAMPDENDPPGTQHYGANIIRHRQGNGLRIALLMRYLASEQRIFQEIAYSWDGAKWKRFPGMQPLLDNGPKGSWTAGYISASPFVVEANGKIYQLLCWTASAYHICSEMMWLDNYKKTSGAAVKKFMEHRGIKDWPLFKQYKNYDDLAADIRDSKINVGIMSWRKDGLFAASAAEQEGSFLTHTLKAKGKLQINAAIASDGYIEVRLADETGKLLPDYQKRISGVDELALPVFDNLPEKSFKIKINMKNARLYTIDFTE